MHRHKFRHDHSQFREDCGPMGHHGFGPRSRGRHGFGDPIHDIRHFMAMMAKGLGKAHQHFHAMQNGDLFFGETPKMVSCHSINDDDMENEGDMRSMFDGGERGFFGRHGMGFGPGFGGPRGRGPGRPGHRPLGQGDLRWLTLDLIAAQPRHGYEVIKAIEDAVNGHYTPSPGTVYPLLTLLEETGLIESEAHGSKKLYKLTDLGQAEIEANAAQIQSAKARLNEALHRFGGPPAPELMRAMGNLRAAIHVRLSKGELSGEALAAVTAALDRAASEIEQS